MRTMSQNNLLNTMDRLVSFLSGGFAGMDEESVRAAIRKTCEGRYWKCEWLFASGQFYIHCESGQAWLEPYGASVRCITNESGIPSTFYDTESLGKWLDATKLRLSHPPRPRRDV